MLTRDPFRGCRFGQGKTKEGYPNQGYQDWRAAEPGTIAVIKYQGFLNRGDKICSSDDQPANEYRFEVGGRDPTAMLETSVIGMREGGMREARVSPHLAYREGTGDGRIPPNAVIKWVIELIRVENGS